MKKARILLIFIFTLTALLVISDPLMAADNQRSEPVIAIDGYITAVYSAVRPPYAKGLIGFAKDSMVAILVSNPASSKTLNTWIYIDNPEIRPDGSEIDTAVAITHVNEAYTNRSYVRIAAFQGPFEDYGRWHFVSMTTRKLR